MKNERNEDADALIKRIQDEHKFGSLMLSNMIAEMPTVEDIDSAYAHGFTDAESKLSPKHGEWADAVIEAETIDGVKTTIHAFECSVCGWGNVWNNSWNFCPNCGANMKGVGNAE